MANATKVDLRTPEVEIDRIHVVEGRNPRRWFDPEALDRLAASIKDQGVIEPVGVEPDGEDGFALRFGERRLRAAKAAGLRKIPVTLNGKDTSNSAAAENDHVETPDPVAKARGWAAVAAEHNLTRHADIAEAVNFEVAKVSAHLRLLKLPEGVQTYISKGVVPMTAEPQLRAVAKVSPRIAECICELAERRKVEPHRFVARFADLLCETAEARFEDPPTMIPTRRVTIAEAVADRTERRRLLDRIAEIFPSEQVDDGAELSFSDSEIDAARAARCLIEHEEKSGEWVKTHRFITDAVFAADLTDRAIERVAAEVAESQRQIEEREREAEASRQGGDPSAAEDKQAEERKAQAAERRKKKADAETFNQEVGRLLIKSRGKRAQKQRAMVRLRALAEYLLTAYPEMPARGLRLVLPQLREVESKPTKSGTAREKITYASSVEATEYFLARLGETKTLEEAIELLGQLVVAAAVADEMAVPQVERLDHRMWVPEEIQQALAADIKAATPSRPPAKK